MPGPYNLTCVATSNATCSQHNFICRDPGSLAAKSRNNPEFPFSLFNFTALRYGSTSCEANAIIHGYANGKYICWLFRDYLKLSLRSKSASRLQLVVPRYRLTTLGRRAFAVMGPTVWNSLPDDLRLFLPVLKTFLFSQYYTSLHSALEISMRMRYINPYIITLYIYTVFKKNYTLFIFAITFFIREPIFIIFGKSVAKEYV